MRGRLRQQVCKRTSGGGTPGGGTDRDFDPVGVADTAIHRTAVFEGVERTETFLGHWQQAPDDRRGALDLHEGFAALVRRHTAANGDSTTFVVRRWRQCSFESW
jgi:hypothetical protein